MRRRAGIAAPLPSCCRRGGSSGRARGAAGGRGDRCRRRGPGTAHRERVRRPARTGVPLTSSGIPFGARRALAPPRGEASHPARDVIRATRPPGRSGAAAPLGADWPWRREAGGDWRRRGRHAAVNEWGARPWRDPGAVARSGSGNAAGTGRSQHRQVCARGRWVRGSVGAKVGHGGAQRPGQGGTGLACPGPSRGVSRVPGRPRLCGWPPARRPGPPFPRRPPFLTGHPRRIPGEADRTGRRDRSLTPTVRCPQRPGPWALRPRW